MSHWPFAMSTIGWTNRNEERQLQLLHAMLECQLLHHHDANVSQDLQDPARFIGHSCHSCLVLQRDCRPISGGKLLLWHKFNLTKSETTNKLGSDVVVNQFPTKLCNTSRAWWSPLAAFGFIVDQSLAKPRSIRTQSSSVPAKRAAWCSGCPLDRNSTYVTQCQCAFTCICSFLYVFILFQFLSIFFVGIACRTYVQYPSLFLPLSLPFLFFPPGVHSNHILNILKFNVIIYRAYAVPRSLRTKFLRSLTLKMTPTHFRHHLRRKTSDYL